MHIKEIVETIKKNIKRLLKEKKINLIMLISFVYTFIIVLLIGVFSQSYNILTLINFMIFMYTLIFMLFGIYIVKIEKRNFIKKLGTVDPEKMFRLIISKVVVLLIYILVFSVVNFFIISINLLKDGIFTSVFLDTIVYIFVYWCLPFLICGLIGMITGLYAEKVKAILITIIIWSLITPINFLILNIMVDFFGNYGYEFVANSLNIGKESLCVIDKLSLNNDPLFMYIVDMPRIVNSLILLLVIIFIFAILILTNFNKYRRSNYIAMTTILFLVVFIFLYNKYPKQYYEFKDKYYMSDKDFYSNYDIHNMEMGDEFKVVKYNIDIELNSFLNLETSINVKAENNKLKNLSFILYHRFEVEEVLLADGKGVIFEQNKDQLKIVLQEEVEKGKIVNIIIKYKGTGSDDFYANEKAAILPAYFNWIPCPHNNENLTFIETNNAKILSAKYSKSEYELNFKNDKTLYTNLYEGSKRNQWKGEVNNGITVLIGEVARLNAEGINNVYPKYEVGFGKYSKEYTISLIEKYDEINKKFFIKNESSVRDIFYIPLKNIKSNSKIKHMEDHFIIGLDDTKSVWKYNEAKIDENNIDNIVFELILGDSSKMDYSYLKYKDVFIYMLVYWEKINERDRNTEKLKKDYNLKIKTEKTHLDGYVSRMELSKQEIENEKKLYELRSKIKEYIDKKLDEHRSNEIDEFFLEYFKLLKIENYNKEDITKFLLNFDE